MELKEEDTWGVVMKLYAPSDIHHPILRLISPRAHLKTQWLHSEAQDQLKMIPRLDYK